MTNTRTAVVLMAYGTPRSRDEILPYYTDIRRGRPPTPEQLADLVARYEAIAPPGSDILSPLAARTEAQRAGLQAALDTAAPGQYHVVLGLKHAEPMIETAVAELVADGFQRIVGLVLAPHYSSYSIGQYIGRGPCRTTRGRKWSRRPRGRRGTTRVRWPGTPLREWPSPVGRR